MVSPIHLSENNDVFHKHALKVCWAIPWLFKLYIKYKTICTDVGTYGKPSCGGIFLKCILRRKLSVLLKSFFQELN
jgi:hypothetical protein